MVLIFSSMSYFLRELFVKKESKNIVKLPFQNIHSLDVLIGYTYRTHNTNTQGNIEGLLLNCDNIKYKITHTQTKN